MWIRHAATAASLLLAVCLAAPGILAQTDLEPEARAIEDLLIAPCCFSQQVSVHQSAAAAEVRRDIRDRLAAGETQQGILGAYVAEYGNQILATPPAEGINLLLYVTPVVVLLWSVGLIVLVVRRLTGREAVGLSGAPPTTSPWTPEAQAKLDDELLDLD